MEPHRLHPAVFTREEMTALAAQLPVVEHGGARSQLDAPAVQAIAQDPRTRALVGERRCVRGLLFDKTAGSNWGLGWHQDTSVAVRERRDVPGFGPWTVKAGVTHAIAPRALLERMVTLRIHLDDCLEDRGPLRVRPEGGAEDTIVAAAGDVFRFCPLLFHASGASRTEGHRRVLQLEFAADALPAGLQWRWWV